MEADAPATLPATRLPRAFALSPSLVRLALSLSHRQVMHDEEASVVVSSCTGERSAHNLGGPSEGSSELMATPRIGSSQEHVDTSGRVLVLTNSNAHLVGKLP